MTNPLVPLLIRHGVAGLLAGWTFVGAMLAFDVATLRTLIFAEAAWWLPLGLLSFGISVTFASAAMGAGIMGLGRSDPPAGTRPAPLFARLGPARAVDLRAVRISSRG